MFSLPLPAFSHSSKGFLLHHRSWKSLQSGHISQPWSLKYLYAASDLQVTPSLLPTIPLETTALVSKGFFPDSLCCSLISFSSSSRLLSDVFPEVPYTPHMLIAPRKEMKEKKKGGEEGEEREKNKSKTPCQPYISARKRVSTGTLLYAVITSRNIS